MADVHRWRCAACGYLQDSVCLPARWRLRYIRTAAGYAERTLCDRQSCAERFGGYEQPPTERREGADGEK